ncbi:hypothetical protein LOTGIDRAFT_130105 [Lottia gigantea]|uniref:cholesterol 7-desaturase n=1 Tax=Lottia gigantea TaxID=225164 RepID=V3ZNN8_LOTGI|nr:hypothetical protein LOTGIDRAFT_130105 [Lottia gigantea]ESO85922.1 hypothetical protein LOTGIDRAFT_130105 [Lottia gigantea]
MPSVLETSALEFERFYSFINSTKEFVVNTPELQSWTTYVYVSVAVMVLWKLYCLLFVPLNRVRKLSDVGYLTDPGFSKRETANNVRKRRKIGDIPPVYPNGWFGLCESFQIEKKDVKYIEVLGLNLAVFRGENGEAFAVDAYCPHMGANMAAGGRVEGSELVCPFHAWKFRGDDGVCSHIPYCEKVPSVAKVKSWPVMEVNGWIYLWFHAEGIDPSWFPYTIEGIADGSWKYGGRTEHYVNSHIEEIPQNGADVVHLEHVHSPLLGAGVDLRYMWSKFWGFGHHVWNAQWSAESSPNEHIGVMKLGHSIKCFGDNLSIIDMEVIAKQIGPGIVYMEFSSALCTGVYIQSLTPVEPMLQKMVHNIYVNWTVPMCIAKFYLLAEAIQVERDIMIWNNKKYESKPLLVKSAEDGLVARHRRWYQQFYSENSPKFTFQKNDLEW